MPNNIYLLEADSFTSFDTTIKEIISKHNYNDNSISNYDLEEDLLSSFLEDLDTYSFLSPQKIIVLKNPLFLSTNTKIKYNEEEIKHFLKYLNNPSLDVLLIICLKDKLDERKKITKTLKSKAKIISIKTDSNTYIKNKLTGYKIDFKALKLLEEYTNNNIMFLDKELDKLMLYKLDSKEINEEDIKDICIKLNSDIDKLTFTLIDSIMNKNKKRIITNYKDLIDVVDPNAIISLLDSQLRLIYQVKDALKLGIKKDEISKILKVHPYRVQKAIEFSYNFTRCDLSKLFSNLSDLDYDIKTGKTVPQIGLELLLLNID